jgi:hypothetical protein
MNLLLVHNYTREIAFQQELAGHWSIDGKKITPRSLARTILPSSKPKY